MSHLKLSNWGFAKKPMMKAMMRTEGIVLVKRCAGLHYFYPYDTENYGRIQPSSGSRDHYSRKFRREKENIANKEHESGKTKDGCAESVRIRAELDKVKPPENLIIIYDGSEGDDLKDALIEKLVAENRYEPTPQEIKNAGL